MILLEIIAKNPIVQGVLLCSLAFFGYEGWKFHERFIGAETVRVEIIKEADDATKLAEAAKLETDRQATHPVKPPAFGKRVRGPYERKDDSRD